jgi:hypothetical protein
MDIDPVYSMYLGLLRDGNDPERAAIELARYVSRDLVDLVVERYDAIAERIITAREPETLNDPNRIVPWYQGPRQGDVFWPVVREELHATGFDTEALNSLDIASTKVVAHLPPPWMPDFNGRGLVLGYVQSGKTSNFTAVIAKAADAGYRLFIVLSGIHTNLRRQTQLRLEEQLIGSNTSSWIGLTTPEADFGAWGNADALMSQDTLRVLAVVKKNKRRLENVIAWLASASDLARRNCPILVIDDEADQASVNTRDASQRSAINRLTIEILDQPRIAYIGYTATPFANIFIDPTVPEDLYPRDFIVDLPRPVAYFGPERIFGREPLTSEEADESQDGLDMVRQVPDDEIVDLRPPTNKQGRQNWDPVVTDSLAAAIRYFVMATAARRVRGHAGRHSSMLLHTTQYADLHHRYRDPITSVLRAVARQVDTGDVSTLEQEWREESERVRAESVGETAVPFSALVDELPTVLADVRIVVDNYTSEERLNFGADPQVVIAIGGNTLSRGLTLEGLVVSFFLRTATAYDTLLQMGRWFGFRSGYADLPRIWMTSDLAEYFQFLATVEAEIRTDVVRYEDEDLTPSEFAVRIRTHPQLAITSAMKMRDAQPCEVSYSGRRIQTILFEHRDEAWLARNRGAVELLLRSSSDAVATQCLDRGRFLWRGVDVSFVSTFLEQYQFHPDAHELVTSRIVEYIRRQNEYGELLEWNIGVVGRADSRWGTIPLGFEHDVGLINRAAVKTLAKPHANIKSLMSTEDRALDLGLDPEQLRGLKDAQLQALRPPRTGLLIVYPINKDSVPRSSESRVPLQALDHVMGIGMVFPDALRQETAVTYMSAVLPLGDVEEIDEPDPEEIDTELDRDEVSA